MLILQWFMPLCNDGSRGLKERYRRVILPALDRFVASRYFIVLVKRSNRYRIAGAWSGPREEDERRRYDPFERCNARYNEFVRVKVI